MRNKNYLTKLRDGDDPFSQVKIYLPNTLMEQVRQASARMQMPVSRLIIWAIFNELETKKPFHFGLDLPANFIPGQYLDEAGKLYRFLMRFPHGTSLDICAMSLPVIGIKTKTELLHAYLQLKHDDVVYEYHPGSKVFNYHPDFKFIKVKGAHGQEIRKVMYKKIEGIASPGARAKRYKEVKKKGVLDVIDVESDEKEE